jgi:hypothetical protein
MVRVGDWKLTYEPLTNGARYRLFNIRDDPGCQRNVLDKHPQIADRLKSMLDQWMDDDPKSGRTRSVEGADPRSAEVVPAVGADAGLT